MDIRKGDTVHLRVTVDGVCGKLVIFRCMDGTKIKGMKSHIIAVEPRPLAVGDIISHESTMWEVRGSEEGRLWIRRAYDGCYKSVHQSDVRPR